MRQTRTVWGLLVFAVAVCLCALIMRPRETQTVVPLQTKGPAVLPPAANTIDPAQAVPAEGGSSLSLLGSIQSAALASLSVRIPAKIAAVDVREGESVRKGQLLVLLDDSDMSSQTRTAVAGVQAAQAQQAKAEAGRTAQRIKADADVSAARSGLAQAQGKLDQAVLGRDAIRSDVKAELKTAQEGVRKAEIGLAQARKTLHGLEELAQVGGVSRNDLEGARAQAATAESDLETARAQVKRVQAGPSPGVSYRLAAAQKDVEAAQAGAAQARDGVNTAEAARKQVLAVADAEVRAAVAAVVQAQAGVGGARSAEAASELRSPIDGVATGVTARVGETAQPGIGLTTVVSLADLRVEALVPGRLLPRLHVGQSAQVAVDTLPGKTFPVAVSEIARIAEPDGRSFRVRFRFARSVSLRPGQAARIAIRTP